MSYCAAEGTVPDPASRDPVVQAELERVARGVLNAKADEAEGAPRRKKVATLREAARAFWSAWLADREPPSGARPPADALEPSRDLPAEAEDPMSTAEGSDRSDSANIDTREDVPSRVTMGLWAARLAGGADPRQARHALSEALRAFASGLAHLPEGGAASLGLVVHLATQPCASLSGAPALKQALHDLLTAMAEKVHLLLEDEQPPPDLEALLILADRRMRWQLGTCAFQKMQSAILRVPEDAVGHFRLRPSGGRRPHRGGGRGEDGRGASAARRSVLLISYRVSTDNPTSQRPQSQERRVRQNRRRA